MRSKKGKLKYKVSPLASDLMNQLFATEQPRNVVPSFEPSTAPRYNSSCHEFASFHKLALDVIHDETRNYSEFKALANNLQWLYAGINPYSEASLEQRKEKLMKGEIERSFLARKQSQHINVKPSEIAAQAESIRIEITEALKAEVKLRLAKDQIILKGGIKENAKLMEPVRIGVAKTDDLIAKLYHLLLQSATRTFIDLHFLHLVEAKVALTLFLKHISSLRGTSSEKVTVVTGRGLHSKGGAPIIRPAIQNYLKSHNIEYKEQPGSFLISPT